MSRAFVLAATAVNEFTHGFAVCLLTAMTAKNLFGRKVKKYLIFSLAGGAALSAAITVIMAVKGMVNATAVFDVFYGAAVISQWLILTDRSRDSLASLVFAFVFSLSVITAAGSIVYAAAGAAGAFGAFRDFEFVVYIFQYALSALFMLLLCRIAGYDRYEPLTFTNMLFLSLPVYFISAAAHSSFLLSEDYTRTDPAALVPVSAILLFIAASVLLSIKSTQYKYLERLNALNSEYLEAQARHFESVRKNDTELRRINHDMKNHFICMNELCRNGKYDELNDYLQKFGETLQAAQPTVNTGNEIADAIIGEKMLSAKGKAVVITADGNFGALTVSAADLCTILSNLIDNAVEAASDERVINKSVSVSCRRTNNFVFLTVENSTASPVDVSSVPGSSKEDKKRHGFGIGNVRGAAAKYGGELVLSCEESGGAFVFRAEVILPQKL